MHFCLQHQQQSHQSVIATLRVLELFEYSSKPLHNQHTSLVLYLGLFLLQKLQSIFIMKILLIRINSQTLKNSLTQFLMSFKLRIHQLLSWQLNQLAYFALIKHA